MDRVIRELNESGHDDAALRMFENQRDMAGLGPRDMAREEGADPDDGNGVEQVANAIELVYLYLETSTLDMQQLALPPTLDT